MVEYYIDYQALPILFDVYGIDRPEDKQAVLGMMCRIARMHDEGPLTTEQIFGWAPIPDEDDLP